MPDEDDDVTPTTRKSSGSIAVFETTCEDVIAKLSGDDSEKADELRHEGRQLVLELKAWKETPPDGTRRSEIISRVMDLHCATSAYRSKP